METGMKMHEFVYQDTKKVAKFGVITKVNLSKNEKLMKAMLKLLLGLDWKKCEKEARCSIN